MVEKMAAKLVPQSRTLNWKITVSQVKMDELRSFLLTSDVWMVLHRPFGKCQMRGDVEHEAFECSR